MVDLVKIRKKSKDSKEAGSTAVPRESHAAAEADEKVQDQPAEDRAPGNRGAISLPPVEPESVEAGPAQASLTEQEPAPPPPEPIVVAKKPAPEAAVKASPKVVETPASLPPVVASPPSEAASSAQAAVKIEAVDALDDASEDRLARFKRLAGKRRGWTAASRSSAEAETEPEGRAGLELLRFRVAGEDYAVDIEKIVEIVPPRMMTRVPNADEAIVGIISLRGTIVTVIDLRRKLGHPHVDFHTLKDARMIVVERAGETAGFLVDRVSRVVKLDPSQLESHPVVSSAEQSEYVSGVFQAQDGLVILLDIERILAG